MSGFECDEYSDFIKDESAAPNLTMETRFFRDAHQQQRQLHRVSCLRCTVVCLNGSSARLSALRRLRAHHITLPLDPQRPTAAIFILLFD